jgi:hypothetical protein
MHVCSRTERICGACRPHHRPLAPLAGRQVGSRRCRAGAPAGRPAPRSPRARSQDMSTARERDVGPADPGIRPHLPSLCPEVSGHPPRTPHGPSRLSRPYAGDSLAYPTTPNMRRHGIDCRKRWMRFESDEKVGTKGSRYNDIVSLPRGRVWGKSVSGRSCSAASLAQSCGRSLLCACLYLKGHTICSC